MKHISYFLAGLLILTACKQSYVNNRDVIQQQLDTLFFNYHEQNLKLNPLAATAIGDKRYNDYLPNTISQAYRDTLISFYSAYWEKLKTIDTTLLDNNHKLSYHVLKWELGIYLEGLTLNDTLFLIPDGSGVINSLFPIDQFWTLNLVMGQLAGGKSAQPFNAPADYRNWLSRVDDYLVWCDTAIANMRKGIELGYVLPKAIVQKVIPQLESFASGPVTKHVFYMPIHHFPDTFSDQEKDSIRTLYEACIANKIIPKYLELVTFFKDEYSIHARQSSGMSYLPGGDKIYRYLVKYYTTTNLTPEEIYEIGLKEVERITGEMIRVKNTVGYKGDLISFFDYVRNNPDLKPFNEPGQVLNYYHGIHHKMKEQLNTLFKIKPETPFEIRRTEAFREASSSAGYSSGSLSGDRPGVFYVPIPDVREHSVYTNECLFLHEAIPGHHYQISLQQENKSLPMFRRLAWYNAFGEGWALYCESLGKELGLYTDPYQYFGMLSYEIHRAIRLVVDVGLHVKGWSREEAIEYSLKHEAMPRARIEAEVERYMAGPAQALSYKVGQLKILELKAMAKRELEDDFNIREFHTLLLESGCLPLSLLEHKIYHWILVTKSQEE